MLGIIIGDDDRFMLELSRDMVDKCIQRYSLAAKVVCIARDFKKISGYLNSNPGVYLYYLDYDFGKAQLNGLDIARCIREKEPQSKIVYVTSHADMALPILKSGVEPFGFIEKTPNKEKMILAYKEYIELALGLLGNYSIGDVEGKLKLPVGVDEYIELLPSQILYVETDKSKSHFLCYHTIDRSTLTIRDSIENALAFLGNGFMKSHRSVIINKQHVIAVENGMVRFANGECAECSFRMKNSIVNECLK